MLKPMKIARGLVVTVMIVFYAVLVHYVNSSGQASILGAILALIPIFLVVITYALKSKSRIAGIGLLLTTCVGSWLAWSFIQQHTGLIFWIQDIGLMTVLLATFGRTLQQGQKPLCVFFAEIIHGGTLPAEHERYAHKVTVAWVIFFALMIATSTLLFFLTSLATWSLFVNFFTLPLVGLMFVVEFAVRRRVLVDLPTGHILDAVRAYMNNSARVH